MREEQAIASKKITIEAKQRADKFFDPARNEAERLKLYQDECLTHRIQEAFQEGYYDNAKGNCSTHPRGR